MDIKILRGSRINDLQSKSSILPQSHQSLPADEGPGLLSRLGLTAVKGLEVPGQLINKLNMALGEPSFIQKPLSEDIQQRSGYTPEQFEPQGPIERYAQKVAYQAPTAALFGPASVVQSAASAIPASLSGEFGAPKWLQDLIQFGSDIGIGKYYGKFTGIKSAQKKAYDAARSLSKEGERVIAQPVVSALTDVGKNLSTETDMKKVKRVEHIIDTVKKNLNYMFEQPNKSTDMLDPKIAMDIRRKIYDTTRKYPDIVEYTKPITEGINNFFAQYGAQNSRFFEQLKRGDQLTAARNMSSFIEKGIDAIPIHGSIADFGKSFFKGILGKTAGEVEKTVRRLVYNPSARDVYFDLVKSVGQQNPSLILRNLNDLSSVLKEEPIEFIPFQESKQQSGNGIRMIRGQKVR